MGVHEGRGQLTRALAELMLRWNETKVSWDDANSRHFEKTVLEPLELDLRSALSAMDHMSQLLGQIRRDCGE